MVDAVEVVQLVPVQKAAAAVLVLGVEADVGRQEQASASFAVAAAQEAIAPKYSADEVAEGLGEAVAVAVADRTFLQQHSRGAPQEVYI